MINILYTIEIPLRVVIWYFCQLLTGVNFKEVNEDNKRELFREIYSSIDTLAFTFGNVWVQLDPSCGVLVVGVIQGRSETSTVFGDLTLSQQWKCLRLLCLISLRVLFFFFFYLCLRVIALVTQKPDAPFVCARFWLLYSCFAAASQSVWLPYGRCREWIVFGARPDPQEQGKSSARRSDITKYHLEGGRGGAQAVFISSVILFGCLSWYISKEAGSVWPAVGARARFPQLALLYSKSQTVVLYV